MQQDKVYPATKPNPPPPQPMNGAAAAAATPHSAAAPITANGITVKPPPYNPAGNRRPSTYRPQPRRSPHRRCTCRRFCCLCFLYTLITLLSLLLLVAITACIFYLLYHPKHPSFSVSSLRISAFNLTPPTSSSSNYPYVTSRLDLTLTAKNPNNKLITFFYDPVTVSVSSEGADLGNSSIPAFTSVPGNVTVLAASVASDPTKGQDPDAVNQLTTDLGKKGGGFPVDLELDTKVKVHLGNLKTKNVGIRVSCSGIRGLPPSAPKKNSTVPTPTLAGTADAKCKFLHTVASDMI
ncbi:hypothetical protein Dimus_027801 [Dionaea muscipula]